MFLLFLKLNISIYKEVRPLFNCLHKVIEQDFSGRLESENTKKGIDEGNRQL